MIKEGRRVWYPSLRHHPSLKVKKINKV